MSRNIILNQNAAKHEELLSDNYLETFQKKYTDDYRSRLYSRVIQWYSNLSPALYFPKLNELEGLGSKFAQMIIGLCGRNYQQIQKSMQNSVWFAKGYNDDAGWLIKLNFHVSNDLKQLYLNIKISNVGFCHDTKHCIIDHYGMNVKSKETSYVLCGYGSNCSLPIVPLLTKMFVNQTETNKYIVLRESFDISELQEIRHWALLYEFMIKITHYKDTYRDRPKIYYGDFKGIKNDSVRELFHNLNKIVVSLVKILKYFKNYGRHTEEDKKKCSQCNHKELYMSSDDYSCDYCGRFGGCNCEMYA